MEWGQARDHLSPVCVEFVCVCVWCVQWCVHGVCGVCDVWCKAVWWCVVCGSVWCVRRVVVCGVVWWCGVVWCGVWCMVCGGVWWCGSVWCGVVVWCGVCERARVYIYKDAGVDWGQASGHHLGFRV